MARRGAPHWHDVSTMLANAIFTLEFLHFGTDPHLCVPKTLSVLMM